MPVSPARQLGVLIVDDSAISREALRHVVQLSPQLSVVGEAATGEVAIDLARKLKPNLITMDLNMPGMGGLKAIEVIMRERPTPLVVISERTSSRGFDVNYEAISRGALELVPKSSVFGVNPTDAKRFAERLTALAMAELESDATHPTTPQPIVPPSEAPLLLGIGASTGGPKAVGKLLSEMARPFSIPIAVVQHMAEDFFDSYVRFLGDASGHAVEQAKAGTRMEAGRVYVAPPRQEMFVREDLTVRLAPPPPDALISPSVDSLFFSMATSLKAKSVGVLLTGMGDDGAQGLLRMKRLGARTVVQDRASCAVFGMPKAAIEMGAAELVLPLDKMAPVLTQFARPQPKEVREVREAGTPASERPAARRILIVEEDRGVANSAVHTLESAGYEVAVLDNPMMVARTLRKTQADLVLLSNELTAMTAQTVMEALRRHTQLAIPVVLWAELDPTTLAAQAKACGAQGAVRKSSTDLLREVRSQLAVSARPSS